MKRKAPPRYRLDALRRFVSSMLAGAGVPPGRAASMATLLLWSESAGLHDAGLRTLPDLLDHIAQGEIHPLADGKIAPERGATAVLDGQGGLPALVLERAGQIAIEKAREFGVGLVRVRGIGPSGSAAAIVAEVAIGPMIAAAVGPLGAWSVAYPSVEGLPLVIDSAFAPKGTPPPSALLPMLVEGEWLVQVVAVAAMETLAVVQERVSASAALPNEGRLSPQMLEGHRRDAREHGLAIDKSLVLDLNRRAKTMGVAEVL